jgi:hypothetical protein
MGKGAPRCSGPPRERWHSFGATFRVVSFVRLSPWARQHRQMPRGIAGRDEFRCWRNQAFPCRIVDAAYH